MWAEQVKAGVLDWCTPAFWLPAEGRMRQGDGGHRGRSLRLEVIVVGLALGCPDGSKQTGHGREASCPGEVWLWRTEGTIFLALKLLFFELLKLLCMHSKRCYINLSCHGAWLLLASWQPAADLAVISLFLDDFAS